MSGTDAPHVGTLTETSLHAALKRLYAGDQGRTEVPVGGFVVDVVRPREPDAPGKPDKPDELVEIQTRGFSGVRPKLMALLESHPVRLVHPVSVQRWIMRVDETGEVLSRRRSPRRGGPADVAAELVAFPDLLAHPAFTLEVVLVRDEEVRRFVGPRAWRARGWGVTERRLVGVADRLVLAAPGSMEALLPGRLPEVFTTADLAVALGRPRRLAQQLAYCLRRAGAIEPVGRDGNAVTYVRTRPRASEPAGDDG